MYRNSCKVNDQNPKNWGMVIGISVLDPTVLYRIYRLHTFLPSEENCGGINITVAILDIIHCPVLCLKRNVSEIGFCLRFQVEATQLGWFTGAVVGVRRQASFVDLAKPSKVPPDDGD
jgi:hypothetical protein